MNTAIATTLISVLGAGLFGMFFMLFKNLSDTMSAGFAAVNARLDRLEDKVDGLTGEVGAHGERLARIEAKLESDPPAEAA